MHAHVPLTVWHDATGPIGMGVLCAIGADGSNGLACLNYIDPSSAPTKIYPLPHMCASVQ